MGRVIVDMSPSIDGYVAGEGVSVASPFGDAGLRLHRWLGFEGATPAAADDEAVARTFGGAGAVVLGRRMFDVGIGTWGDDGAFGLPCFVVTNRPEPELVRGPTTFTFVTDGPAEAMRRARAAAGDKDVVVPGGADLVRQCLAAGFVDVIHLHVVPVILGRGVPLFGGGTPRYEAETTDVVASPHATHLTVAVKR
ncbi:dihydrofolate reductase [Nonomuraea sp. NN258]|uniref:dihydrofolate reductase family protein n=1 Tax=Nonomuraea antri TaxID=2730852 RepID=UPI0015696AAE|nr:dihydrofolate reductase family protein [Nonomuraea antri]NRQ32216.1 dihydrofolate reductase [Nonomuraea antri]